MKVKTSELKGKALDWAVAKAIRNEMPSVQQWMIWNDYHPTKSWYECGRFIEEFQIFLSPPTTVMGTKLVDGQRVHINIERDWEAKVSRRVAQRKPVAEFMPGGCFVCEGETAHIAVCRVVVAMKLGDEVDIPDQLVP